MQAHVCDAKGEHAERHEAHSLFWRTVSGIKAATSCKRNQSVGEEGHMPAGSGSNPGPPVLYKFHEGYTNAVKRPVFMKDLL